MTREEILDKFKQAGLEKFCEKISEAISDCIILYPKPCKDIPIGASRMGGEPDLPSDIEWPHNNGKPLTFLAQLDLQELMLPIIDQKLEPEWLVFFYDVEEQPWGFDPKHSDGWRIINFAAPVSSLSRITAPKNLSEYSFQPFLLSYKKKPSIPSWESAQEMFEMNDKETDAYLKIYQELYDEDSHHQFLGYPNEIQGPMMLQCHLAANGIYCGDSTYRKHPQYNEVMEKQCEWRLLLQLDSDETIGWMWGDCGRLYFCGCVEQGKAKEFWAILQCG